jgi:hypothetical protein
MLLRINLCILTSDDEAGFVTGDEPCVEYVPGQAWACLNHPEVELTLPFTPRRLALYTWKPAYRMYTSLTGWASIGSMSARLAIVAKSLSHGGALCANPGSKREPLK